MRRAWVLTVLLAGCANDRTAGDSRGATSIAAPTTEAARAALTRLRQTYRQLAPARGGASLTKTESGWVRPSAPTTPRAAWADTEIATASVALAPAAPFRIENGKLAISVQLRDVAVSAGTEAEGDVVHAASFAGAGATYVRHPMAQGVEDLLEVSAVGSAQLEYAVTLEGVAGLRQVGSVVEFLDAEGVPLLRMANPTIEGADGSLIEADVDVVGCAVDRDPRAPWGRGAVAPGASSCGVRVSWAGKTVAYPALIDPSWVSTGTMVTSNRKYHGASLMADGRVLVAGGKFNTSTIPTAEIYDPSTRTWSATGTMPGKSAYQTLTTLPSGVVANVGGVDGANNVTSTLYLYTPSAGTWTTGAPMPNPHSQHTTNLLADGRLLVVAGNATSSSLSSRVELYTPSTNAWTAGPSLPSTLVRHATVNLADGRVLLAGGFTGAAYSTVARLFDPTPNTWATTGGLGVARADLSLTSLGKSGLYLAAGGADAVGSLGSAEIFNLGTGLFTATPALSTPRAAHQAVAIGPEKVLLVGGVSAGGALSSTDLYDVAQHSWTADAALSTAKQGHTSLALSSGAVLTAGSGSAETWGTAPTSGDSRSSPPVIVEWLTGAGTRAATDLLSARLTNTIGGTISVSLSVQAGGLDGRLSTRTIGTYAVAASPVTVTFAAGTLPVQSVGTQAETMLQISYPNGSTTTTAWSNPLFYQFAAGYSSLTIYGATPNSLPTAFNPQTDFGTNAGTVTVDVATYFTKLRDAVQPSFTLSGRVWNAATSQFQEVTTLPRVGGPGGTAWGSIPMGQTFSTIGSIILAFASLTPDSGPVYHIFPPWTGGFTDSGYGEDILTSPSISDNAAYYTQAAIVRRGSGVPVWSGVADNSGQITLQLTPSTDYILILYPTLIRPDGARLDASYRTVNAGTTSAPQKVFPMAAMSGGASLATAIVSRETLVQTFAFTTGPTGDRINLPGWYSDSMTRSMIMLSRAFSGAGADTGLLANGRYRAHTDEGCGGGLTAGSACYAYRTFYVGPAPDTTHDSFWKFIISHEFGHNAFDFLFGALTKRDDPYGVTNPTDSWCDCGYAGGSGNNSPYFVELRRHCLTSREIEAAAQNEGLAHFFAATLWNYRSEADCKFVYYKDSARDTGGSQPKIDPAPVARSCDTPVKWLESHCGGQDGGPYGGPSGVGVEWDWMNFYVDVNKGTSRTTISDLSQIYQTACAGDAGPQPCNGQEPSFASLSTSAVVVFGATDVRAQKFSNSGGLNGVNH